MSTMSQSVSVAASVEQAWRAIVDFESRPRWSPRVKEARVLDGGPLREGSRIQLRIDSNRFTPTVVEMSPPERLVLLVRGPGFRARHDYQVHAATQGSNVVLTAGYSGILGAMVGRLMPGSIRRDLADELAAIKAAAEAGPA